MEARAVVVGNWLWLLTVCHRTGEPLDAKRLSPPKTAVMLKIPAVLGMAVVRLATPPLSGAAPSTFTPLKNTMDSPSGGTPPGELTAAVNVTNCLARAGLELEFNLIVVGAIADFTI